MMDNVVTEFTPGERPVVVFVHIPKTGGTTVRRYLMKHFPKSIRFDSLKAFSRDFVGAEPEQKDQFDLISGHVPTGVIHHHTTRPCFYLTFFRDPLAKMISNYSHVLRWPSHRWHRRFVAKKITLEKFLTRHEDVRDFLLDNPMTRCFSDPLQTHDERPLTAERVEQIKDRLGGQFGFIGLAERDADSIFLLSRKLGRKPRHYLSHNVTRRVEGTPAGLSGEVVARFRELNWADYELYAYAEQAFERRWSELGGPERKRVERYRRVQRLLKGVSFKARDTVRDGRTRSPDPGLPPS